MSGKMAQPWNHNIHYHSLVISAIPPLCRQALDVGCGEGMLTRELALYFERVVGIDPDQAILAQAVHHNQGIGNIVFINGDVMNYPFVPASFDMVAAVATLHHLPLKDALMRFKDLLAPGGVLIIVGLYKQRSFTDHLFTLAGFVVSLIMRLRKPYCEIEACMTIPLQTLGEIRKAVKMILPGAIVKRRLIFRYSLIWVKPISDFETSTKA